MTEPKPPVVDEVGVPFPDSWQPMLQQIADAGSDAEAITIALGSASACWRNLERAGIFESDRCMAIDIVLKRVLGVS